MITYIEGLLVELPLSGTVGILKEDYTVYELGDLAFIEIMREDGTWENVTVFMSVYEGMLVYDEEETEIGGVGLGMRVRHGVWSDDFGGMIPDGIDNELPECFLR